MNNTLSALLAEAMRLVGKGVPRPARRAHEPIPWGSEPVRMAMHRVTARGQLKRPRAVPVMRGRDAATAKAIMAKNYAPNGQRERQRRLRHAMVR